MVLHVTDIRSSLISALSYDAGHRLLWVTLKSGAIYIYARVPWAAVIGLCEAKSMGADYNEFIRNRYDYLEV